MCDSLRLTSDMVKKQHENAIATMVSFTVLASEVLLAAKGAFTAAQPRTWLRALF